MAGAASAHQAATASREQNSQQRAGRTRRTSAEPQRAQQGATAAAADAPAALQTLSRLQHLADASPQVAQLRRLQALADGRFAPVAQLAGDPEEEERVQGKFATAQRQPQLQQAPRANNTGLPDKLKSGIESLSGLSMDHVRVHYNSSQPAQLNALAYAQGSDIHLAPGQEQHLPHEAWHVVQQAQGRVRPTLQINEGVQANDDVGLEREADVMGAKAVSVGVPQGKAIVPGSIDSMRHRRDDRGVGPKGVIQQTQDDKIYAPGPTDSYNEHFARHMVCQVEDMAEFSSEIGAARHTFLDISPDQIAEEIADSLFLLPPNSLGNRLWVNTDSEYQYFLYYDGELELAGVRSFSFRTQYNDETESYQAYHFGRLL
jgi:hypothetical protein